MNEETGFERKTLLEVLETFLYTSDNMFGEIVHDAQRELYKRVTPPEWAMKHPLPILAKEWHGKK